MCLNRHLVSNHRFAHNRKTAQQIQMKKKLSIALLIPSLLLFARQPLAPDVQIQTTSTPEPTPAVAVVPAVIGGALVVGGLAWLGIKIADAIMNAWERHLTNNQGGEINYILPPPLPDKPRQREESGL